MEDKIGRKYFTVYKKDIDFISAFRYEHRISNFSDTFSALISEFQKILDENNELKLELKNEKEKNSVMLQATTRNSSIALMMLDAIGIDVATTIEDYHDVKQESSLLQSARAVYQERLEAARTKKSNGD